MARDCYRCGAPVKDDEAFCPACRAPQVKVSDPAGVDNEFPLAGEERVPLGDGPTLAHSPQRVQWGLFFRLAAPISVLVGFLTAFLFPVGLLLALPLCLRGTFMRYRKVHAAPVRTGQGAMMGAFMACLSFVSFLAFFLAALSINRPAVVTKIREYAAQSGDPQVQAQMLWYTGDPGFAIITAVALFFFLTLFLIVAMASGALMAGSKSSAPPQ